MAVRDVHVLDVHVMDVHARKEGRDRFIHKNSFNNDLLPLGKISRFISDSTGYSEEKSYLELTMPRAGRKSRFIERSPDFSSLMDLSYGKPGKEDVAKFMSEKLGLDYEKACMDLNMPRVDHHKANDILHARNIDGVNMFF